VQPSQVLPSANFFVRVAALALKNDATTPAITPGGLQQKKHRTVKLTVPDLSPAGKPNLKETHDANVDEN
jgi:CheY-specific phosphatase CheX